MINLILRRRFTCVGASAIAFSLAFTPTFPTHAGIVRKIAVSQVSGQAQENSALQTIEVWNGHGVSISFYQTGEIVKKIWLDDPSSVVLDVDGCLEGLGKCSAADSGAGLIHLRQINKIFIPGLPQAEYGTHMTVVTESKTNADVKNVYHFRVISGSGKPKYSEIEIVDDRVSTRLNDSKNLTSTSLRANYKATNDSKLIAQGMQVALANKLITTNSPLWQRLSKVVELRSEGAEFDEISRSVGVSRELIEKLIKLGRSDQRSNR